GVLHPVRLLTVLPASLAHDVWFLLGPCDGGTTRPEPGGVCGTASYGALVHAARSHGSWLKAQKDPGATLPGSFLPSRIAHMTSGPEADCARSCVPSITSSGHRVS